MEESRKSGFPGKLEILFFVVLGQYLLVRRPLWGQQACEIVLLSLPPPVVLPLGVGTGSLIGARAPDGNPASPFGCLKDALG